MSRTLETLLALITLAAVGCGGGNQEGSGGGTSSAGGGSTTSAGTTSSSSTGSCAPEDKAIKLGKLVRPDDGAVFEDAIIVVHGDRISYVGTDEQQIPCGATIIDWTAYTGLPGLIDVHTHYTYQTDDEPGTTPWNRLEWLKVNAPAKLKELAREAALATIAKGVTTAVDKGAASSSALVLDLRDAIASGQTPGPRLFVAGKGIWGPVGSIDKLKAKVQQQVQDGSDLLKVWADGCSDETLQCAPSFTAEEIEAVVTEAHLLGRPVAVHAYHADTARRAIAAGVDSVEHPEGLGAADFADMIAKGVTYVPTIAHNQYYKDNLEMFGYGPEVAAELDAFIQLNLETAGLAHAAGVRIAMGSDAVFSGFGQNTLELGWLVKAGMTPLQALRAATLSGAESIGVQDRIGKVAVGYYADVIAVEGDPLTDIEAVIGGVRGVMKGGELMKF